jgi:hypothetical protein
MRLEFKLLYLFGHEHYLAEFRLQMSQV